MDLLKEQFNNRIDFQEKRPGIIQLMAPFYHEDGDMLDIFIEEAPEPGKIRVCDHGMTLMRLSYSYDIDTPNKEQIFQKIISENGVYETEGTIFIDTLPNYLYPSVLQFSQAVAKVSNMSLYKREVIRSLFFELLAEFVDSNLKKFNPIPNSYPLETRDDLVVDYMFDVKPRPIFLYGIKDNSQARLAAISCLEFQRNLVQFKSIAVHEDFDNLSKRDRKIITNILDKQFTNLDEFKHSGENYFTREMVQ